MNEAEWNACAEPDTMLKALRASGNVSQRKARLFAVAVCRRIWPLLSDERSRTAVEVAERFADGLADRQTRSTARRAASYARDWAFRTLTSQRAMTSDPPMRELIPRFQAAQAATYGLDARLDEQAIALWAAQAVGVTTVGFSTTGLSISPDKGETTRKERRGQADLLRDIFGAMLFRPISIDPSLLTQQDALVRKLAQAAYDHRDLPSGSLDTARLTVLADALEEAGYADDEVMNHLRGPGPHVRGCFALDAVLGRS